MPGAVPIVRDVHFGLHPAYAIVVIVIGLLAYAAVRVVVGFVRGLKRELDRPD